MSLIPPFTVAPIDPKTGRWNRDWWLFLHNMWEKQGGTSDTSDADSMAMSRTRRGAAMRSSESGVAPVRAARTRKADEVAPPRHALPRLQLTKETYKPLTLIRLYTGLAADIPSGWQLADGTNGTPNMKDLFIVGAGNLYGQGTTGGSTTISVSTTTVASGTGTTVVSAVTAPYRQPYYAAAYIINTKTVTIVTDAKLR
jgi:hypothetical protein